ncbi:hypothetical protein R1sor_021034 [Riccia sorocarpa]|uniref:Uncharacterized protein n=1 Tax=Riccia sorocarpa TaxID=122646 RepID=A0ABD3GFX6_9MARC
MSAFNFPNPNVRLYNSDGLPIGFRQINIGQRKKVGREPTQEELDKGLDLGTDGVLQEYEFLQDQDDFPESEDQGTDNDLDDEAASSRDEGAEEEEENDGEAEEEEEEEEEEKEPIPPPQRKGKGKVVQPRGKGRPREVGVVIAPIQRLDSQAEAEKVLASKAKRKASKGKGKNTSGPGGTSGGPAKKKPCRK